MTDTTLVEHSVEARIMTITLQNPPANSYSYAMMKQLDLAVLEARFNDDVDVIVLTGSGDRFFCAGADIADLKSMTPSFKYNFCLHANETLNRLASTAKLVIVGINGHCVGGGLEVALAGDLRVAKSGSYKLGLPESKLGVLAGTGGTQRFSKLLGTSKAIELMATGETFGPDKGVSLGLINEILEGEDFSAALQSYARQFTSPSASAAAIGAMKLSVHGGEGSPLHQGLALERELQQQLFQGPDAKEGLKAFVERRAPQFGRKD